MTVTDQIKILDNKIMQNETQYDLNRKSAKISPLSSNNLYKYEYLTGKDFGLKPSSIEQTKFEYSPLGKTFNKGLDKDDKKEGLFKGLENEIRRKTDEVNKLVAKFRKIDRTLDKAELVCAKPDGTKYDVNHFLLPLKFMEKIHNYEITLDEAIEDQAKLNNSYTPRT